MKKILIFSLLIFGCSSKNNKPIIPAQNPFIVLGHSPETYQKTSVYLYVIDSCEYLGYLDLSPFDMLTHKGNCRFCQKRNQEHK